MTLLGEPETIHCEICYMTASMMWLLIYVKKNIKEMTSLVV
jgi:hypothetical protein